MYLEHTLIKTILTILIEKNCFGSSLKLVRISGCRMSFVFNWAFHIDLWGFLNIYIYRYVHSNKLK